MFISGVIQTNFNLSGVNGVGVKLNHKKLTVVLFPLPSGCKPCESNGPESPFAFVELAFRNYSYDSAVFTEKRSLFTILSLE